MLPVKVGFELEYEADDDDGEEGAERFKGFENSSGQRWSDSSKTARAQAERSVERSSTLPSPPAKRGRAILLSVTGDISLLAEPSFSNPLPSSSPLLPPIPFIDLLDTFLSFRYLNQQGGISSRHDAAPHTLHTRTKANQTTTVVLFKRLYLGEEQRKLPSQGKIAPPPA
ncbi:uncharacterized protein UBRO2_03107 [Ustilago bromivora]|uniref:Uncharacterized protein n=1 Tax=Ustilago bromivora TaxID=307758 RepID=A0A8H8QM35_9BASI|nr:uncharacterized protein UBRO2_03107 [Ustilago bromivora]